MVEARTASNFVLARTTVAEARTAYSSFGGEHGGRGADGNFFGGEHGDGDADSMHFLLAGTTVA